MTILQALEDMKGDQGVLLSGQMGQPTDADKLLRNLFKVVKEFEAKFNGAPIVKSMLNPEEVWAKFEASWLNFGVMSQREIRTICTDLSLATRCEVIDALQASPQHLENKFNLFGFATAYFHGWRSFEAAETTESLIHKSIKLNRTKKRRRFLEVWDEYSFLFSPDAASKVAEIVIHRRMSVHQVCDVLFIDPTSQLAIRVREEATNIATTQFKKECKKLSTDGALEQLRGIVEDVMSKSLEGNHYRTGMSKIIDCDITESSEDFRATLVSLIQQDDRLGDPRLNRNRANWRTMTDEAQRKYLAWLAVETLQFFFNAIVPKNDENRRRAEFWLRYAQRPGLIKDFQVALSWEDHQRLKSSKQILPNYSRVDDGNTSAFLMVFGTSGTDYVVIEFSETANAAYIYEKSKFEDGDLSLWGDRGLSLRRDTFYLRDLKRIRRAELRILHNNFWEQKAIRSLADIGIFL